MESTNVSTPYRDSIRRFLIDLRDQFEHYHERKENMAWLATTFYLTIIAAVFAQLYGANTNQIQEHYRYPLIISLIVTSILTFFFIKQQWTDRGVAAHIVAACGEVLSLVADPAYYVGEAEVKLTHYREANRDYIWPAILVGQLKSPSRIPRYISWNYYAPVVLIIWWTVAVVVFVFQLPTAPCHP